MSMSPSRRKRRSMIARKPKRIGTAALAMGGIALACAAISLERAPRLIVPAKQIVQAKRSLLAAPAITSD